MGTRFLYWEDGATSGAVVYDPRDPDKGQLIVTNDGSNWSCVVKSIPGMIRPPTQTAKLFTIKLANAKPEYRLSVKWAQSVTSSKHGIPPEWYKIHTTTAGKFVDSRVVQYTSPLTKHLGSVTYTGFETIEKQSAHSLEAIHRAINASVARAIEVWGWQCTGLEVCFHKTGRAFGLAYDVGKGTNNSRKISLNALLLERYDLNSVARVAIHELCHHYREERWPRNMRFRHDPHDRLFCTELAKADPEVATNEGARIGPNGEEANRCVQFADIPDSALDSALKAKEAARTIEPTWAPDAGTLELWMLKDGKLRVCWEPRLGFRWTKRVESLSDSVVLELAKRFSPSDWKRVSVHIEPRFANYAQLSEHTKLDEFMAFAVSRYGRQMKKSAAYVTEALEQAR